VTPNQSTASNRRPAGQLDGLGSLAATVAADRAFPAAVAWSEAASHAPMKFSRSLILLLLGTVVLLVLLQFVTSESLPAGWQMRNWPAWAHIASGVFFVILIASCFIFDAWSFFRDIRDSWSAGRHDKSDGKPSATKRCI